MTEYSFAPAYELPSWPFTPPLELQGEKLRHPIVIVGAGLSGLTLACDLAARGIASVLIDEDDTIGVRGASSRGICYSQKSLEIFERLGIYERIAAKGTTWSVGKTFSDSNEVYGFNLQTNSISAQPPFINLQQFYIEWFLVDRIMELGLTELRWKNRLTRVEVDAQGVRLDVETPGGAYTLEADYVIDASGANSVIRNQLKLPAHESRSTDRWCITDVRFKKTLPIERWTWVDAPFNQGRGVWQHLMGDDVWRIDYQMPEDCDVDEITKPEVAGSRLREQLGNGIDFEFVWIGAYFYRDYLLENFRHGRLFFIGDSAHVVSPFGARGGNTGIQDAANLAWKLVLALSGKADPALLETYNNERRAAALQNLEVTSRTAVFMAPRSPAEHTLRRAIVALAKHYPFARSFVNTGRMSVANDYPVSSQLPQGGRTVQNVVLHSPDGARVTLAGLLREGVQGLALLRSCESQASKTLERELEGLPVRLLTLGNSSEDAALHAGEAELIHLGLDQPGNLLLVRPDGYSAASFSKPTSAAVAAAIRTAFALPTQ